MTPLGERDLSILAESLLEHSGRIALRRGSEDEALYAERVVTVRQALLEWGLKPDAFELTDGLSGGAGISSVAMRETLKAATSVGTNSSSTSSSQVPNPRSESMKKCPKHTHLLLLAATLASCASPPHSSYRPASNPEPSLTIDGDRKPTAKTLQTMAHILAKRGNDARCELVLRELIQTHPDYTPAYNELAELHMRADDVIGAMAILEEGLAIRPDDSVLLNNLGLCHLRRGSQPEAAEAFERACVANPKDARARGNLALTMGLQGNLHAAEELFTQASDQVTAWDNMVVICDRLGDSNSARHYRRLLTDYGVAAHVRRHEERLDAAGLR